MEFRPSKWHPLARLFRSYTIGPDGVGKKRGVLSKSHQTVACERITNVDVLIGFLPGSSGVAVNTGAGEPVKLDMLTRQTANEAAGRIRVLITPRAAAAQV